ncbi:MAG TPA: ATP-binding protein, partial [Alphaproteobacteria bacterium]|nr:ATP-binding protein [Alphaproteobacteria bacterium]
MAEPLTVNGAGPARRRLYIRPRTAILAIAACFLLFVLLVELVAARRDYQGLLANAVTQAEKAASAVDQHTRWVVDSCDLLLKRVLADFSGRDLAALRTDPAAWQALDAISRDLPQIGWLAVAGPDGRVMLSTGSYPAAAHDISHRDYFRAHRAGEVFHLGRALRPSTIDGIYFTVSRRIAGPGGQFGGVAAIGLRIDYFADFKDTLALGPDSSIGLIRLNGDIVMRSQLGDGDLERNIANSALFEHYNRDRPSGYYETMSPVDGVHRLVAFRQVSGLPVIAAVGVSRGVIDSQWWDRTRERLMLYAAALTALGALSALALTGVRRESEALRLAEDRSRALAAALVETERARAEAVAANAARSRFLATASHDLRQPLQGARLWLELLLKKSAADSEMRRIAGKAVEALSGGQSLLTALLDISTLEAGTVAPSVRSVPLAEILGPLQSEATELARSKGLTARFVSSRAHIRTDPVLLLRLLRNLVHNAVRYTDRGRILVGARRRGGTLRLEVWDTGIGIPADKLETVFQEFVQLGNPARDRAQGLGLGLSIVERTARLLGHELTVRSVPGRGSMFGVSVPLAAPQAAAPPPPAAEPAGGGARLLLVEDDPLQRGALTALLEGFGYRVEAHEQPGPALEALAAGAPPPDLVVTDFRLPGPHNGVAALALM